MEHIEGMYFVKLAIVGFLLYLTGIIINQLMRKIFEKSKGINEKTEGTILNVTRHSMMGMSVVIFIIYALSPFIDFGKILTGAGILGVIIGLASQNVLKDLFAGFFRITTQQIHKGDVVIINQKIQGTVEEIGMMYLQIREWDGKLTTYNHASIKEIQNYNREKMRVIVEVVASFRENPSKVMNVLEEVCQKLNRTQKEWLIQGEAEQPYQVYGMTSTNKQFLGYQYTVVGLVRDEVYFEALKEARFIIAKALHDNHIRMSEQQVFFKTRA